MKKMLQGVLLLAITVPASVLAAGSDELWEMTTKMDMPGMPMQMPPTTNTVCLSKGEASKPIQDKENKNCTTSDVQTSGNTTRWKMHCTGRDAIEGSGETTHTANTIKGTVKMTMRNGTMTQSISGKLIGSCNAATAHQEKKEEFTRNIKGRSCAGEMAKIAESGGSDAHSKKVSEMSKASENQQGILDMYGVTEKDFSKGGSCADQLPELCKKAEARVSTVAGYETYLKSKGWVAAACKIDLKTKLPAACKDAKDKNNRDFIKQQCPAEQVELCDEAIGKSDLGTMREFCSAGRVAPLCKKAAQEGDYDSIFGIGVKCPAEARAAACKNALEHGSYHDLSRMKEFCPVEIVATECKKMMDKEAYKNVAVLEICPVETIKPYCKSMAAKVDEEAFKVLAEYCPVEAKAVAKVHCEQWGRSYTSDNQMKVCSPYYKYDDNQHSVKDKYNSEDKQAETEGVAGKGSKLMDKLFNRKTEEQPATAKSGKTTAEGDAGEKASKSKEAAAEKPAPADNPVGNILDGAKKLKGLLNF